MGGARFRPASAPVDLALLTMRAPASLLEKRARGAFFDFGRAAVAIWCLSGVGVPKDDSANHKKEPPPPQPTTIERFFFDLLFP